MTRDERQHAEGYTCLDMVESEYALPARDFEAVRGAWKAGAAFWDSETMYGEVCTVKLAKCISISLLTPESIAERERNDREAKERELTQ